MSGTLQEVQCPGNIVLCSTSMRNVADEICEHNKKNIFHIQEIFFRKSCRLRVNVGKYGIAGQATDDMIWYSGTGQRLYEME